MKLMLTATGLCNNTLREALRDLLDKPFESANIVYLPTASVAEPGDHGWFVANMNQLYSLNWHEFDILALNGLPRRMIRDRLLHADIIYAEGGNQYHLARSITLNNLAEDFREALESRVYLGVSAGSMIFSSNLTTHSAEVMGDIADLHALDAKTIEPPFGFFDWYLKPHLNSPNFPGRDVAWAECIAARADFPIYFIDDHTGIRIDGDSLDVLSEGQWLYFP